MKRLALALFALVWLTPSAFAGVVYHWVEDVPNAANQPISATLVFTDAAWLSGGASGTNSYNPCLAPGLEQLKSKFSGFIQPCPDLDVEYDLKVTSAGLEGNIAYRDSEEDYYFEMESVGSIWTVGDFNFFPNGTGCLEAPRDDCDGAIGRWVLDATTVPKVPEPSPLMFLFLAPLAMRVARKQFQEASS